MFASSASERPRRRFVAASLSSLALLGVGLCGAGRVSASESTFVVSSGQPAFTSPTSATPGTPVAAEVVTTTVPTTTGTTTVPPVPSGVFRWVPETHLGVAYATVSPTQTLDLYLPASSGATPVPLVVLIHGGAFLLGDSNAENAYVPLFLQHGVAVASLNYRLMSEARYPAGAQDVKAAVRWLRAHAAEYGIDPERFGAWGQSAGGWMATMLGVTGDQPTIYDDPSLGNADQSSAVQAVASWYGLTDFTTVDAQFATVTVCTGLTAAADPGSFESLWLGQSVLTSPLAASTNLSQYAATAATLPTWYLAHGDQDCIVPIGQSTQLAAALQQAGADVTLVVLGGSGHVAATFDVTQVEPTIDFLVFALLA